MLSFDPIRNLAIALKRVYVISVTFRITPLSIAIINARNGSARAFFFTRTPDSLSWILTTWPVLVPSSPEHVY